jgi:hypothetical protein
VTVTPAKIVHEDGPEEVGALDLGPLNGKLAHLRAHAPLLIHACSTATTVSRLEDIFTFAIKFQRRHFPPYFYHDGSTAISLILLLIGGAANIDKQFLPVTERP